MLNSSLASLLRTAFYTESSVERKLHASPKKTLSVFNIRNITVRLSSIWTCARTSTSPLRGSQYTPHRLHHSRNTATDSRPCTASWSNILKQPVLGITHWYYKANTAIWFIPRNIALALRVPKQDICSDQWKTPHLYGPFIPKVTSPTETWSDGELLGLWWITTHEQAALPICNVTWGRTYLWHRRNVQRNVQPLQNKEQLDRHHLGSTIMKGQNYRRA